MERAIQEFKVETQRLGLQPGSKRKRRAAGLEWHGRLYENFRNDSLDAVPHEIRQRGGTKSLLRRNQFGFNVSGPVYIPHLLQPNQNTFFSLSYEGVREHISRTYLQTIPTIPERTGDYSAVVDQAGNLLPIFDPASTEPNPAFDPAQPVSTSNLQYLRNPFPGNKIPTTRLDPVAENALKYYPLPNTDVGPFFRNNYFINAPETNVANGMIGKLDQSIKDRHRISVELAFSNGLAGAAQWFPTPANPGPTDRHFQTRRGSATYSFTATSRTVNTATFEASSTASQNGNLSDPTNYPAAIGLGGVTGSTFPLFGFSPYLSMGTSYPNSTNARNDYSWTDVLSTSRGKHTLRLVGRYSRQQVNTYWPQYPSGYFQFTDGLTSLPGIVNTGHAFASFLLGMPEYVETSLIAAPSYFRATRASLSFHDHYEVHRGLVFSFTTTLERSTPRTEKYNRQSTVDLQVVDPLTGKKGALIAAGQNGVGEAFQPNRIRLEPSAAIAWSPMGDTNTVLRLSFGRSYSSIPIYSGQWGTQGFNLYPTYISPNSQLQPALLLSAGVPPPTGPVPNLAPNAADNTVADLIDSTDRQPTYQSASFSVERQLPASVVLTAGAAYSGGKNLLVGNGAVNPNAIPLDALQFRDQLNNYDFSQSLRPYPQYKGFNVYSSYPLGRYQRDAAYLKVEKHATAGLTISAYYEFSKQMDDYSGPYGKQDFFNRQNEWSMTNGSRPQYLQLSYIYEFPFGTDKPFLNFGDWRRYLISGWSVSGMGVVYSGDPIALTPAFNNTGGVVQALRVNAVPGVDPNVSDQGPSQWFNPAAFAQPADFTIGDYARTSPTLRNPGAQNFDVTLNKRISMAADRTLEYSAAAFNFLNHANWNNPDPVIGTVTAPNVNAGKIIGSSGGRVVQLGLRFSF